METGIFFLREGFIYASSVKTAQISAYILRQIKHSGNYSIYNESSALLHEQLSDSVYSNNICLISSI